MNVKALLGTILSKVQNPSGDKADRNDAFTERPRVLHFGAPGQQFALFLALFTILLAENQTYGRGAQTAPGPWKGNDTAIWNRKLECS